ncbi:MAG TPA: polysaccharide biosynthesis/export family protein [Candidatus Limnocylindria bacterium]|nr:polysaccharide biosynthesis/export family protein [Candidatus Limnocylindria bacterium]
MNRFYFLLGLALIFGNGCRTKGPVFDPRKSFAEDGFQTVEMTNRIDKRWLQPSTEPYRLGPGDVVEIEVLGEAAARSSLLVGPDGKIYYSLLPATSVWGLTLNETRELLQKELGKFTRATPEMVLNVRVVGSKRYWLLGAVGAGAYTLATPTTLLEAISAVGGFPATGVEDVVDLQKSFVLRDGRYVPVNFERLFKQGDLSENIYLQADDFVYLRPGHLPSVSVLGAVAGSSLVPHTRDLTVARAIIAAGGTMKYAQLNQVVIIRGGLTEPHMAEVDYKSIVMGKAPDVRLQPGDILYVPFSPFRKIAQIAEEILDQVVRTTAVNEGVRVVNPDAQPVGFSAPFGPGGGTITPP